jgi:Domain of unknown function (DUF4062)
VDPHAEALATLTVRAKPAPTVFISSTAEDLKRFRAAARDAALAARFLPEMQEYFAARDHPPLLRDLHSVSFCFILPSSACRAARTRRTGVSTFRCSWVGQDGGTGFSL